MSNQSCSGQGGLNFKKLDRIGSIVQQLDTSYQGSPSNIGNVKAAGLAMSADSERRILTGSSCVHAFTDNMMPRQIVTYRGSCLHTNTSPFEKIKSVKLYVDARSLSSFLRWRSLISFEALLRCISDEQLDCVGDRRLRCKFGDYKAHLSVQ